MSQQNDRRMFERLQVDFSAKIKPLQTQKAFFAQCYNISASGAGLFAKRILEPSTYLEICISVLNEKICFHSIGKIIWITQTEKNKWRAGIEFETIEFLKLNRFIEFVKYSPQCNAL